MTTNLREQLETSLGSTYTVERELGGGGMSRVFLAEERRLGRRVVVKVLSPELAADVSAERFERETRVAAKLNDPRIVPVLSAGDVAGLPFYTMPFIDGASLRSRLQDGPIPLAAAISFLRDIALALEHAHEQGIVHRDIKPENVLITARGGASGRVGTAMVTDFGISKAISAATGTARTDGQPGTDVRTLTQIGSTLGTPAYMAPEQAAGDSVDPRADLYAWGVVAYEVLTGAHPFAERKTPSAMVTAHIRDSPRPLVGRAGLPPSVAAVVDRCLAKDPAARPDSAGLLVAALDTAAPAGNVRPRRSRSAMVTVVAATVAAASAVAVLSRRDAGTTGGASARKAANSIAVLPFANQGADSSDVYFAEGMSDELTTALGKLTSVRVASRSSAARYRNSTAREAARALNVDAVLEGKVSRSGDRFRIAASLTNGSDGMEVWSQSFVREAKDVFEVQDMIARAIVDSLRFALTGQSANAAAAPRGTSDLQAYDLYLKGRYAWSKRGRDLLGAVSFYEQAIVRDSNFARAYAGLAMAYSPMIVYGVGHSDSVLPRAERSALRALALDSTLAEAHLALANVWKMQWRWNDAEPHFRAAIRYSPSDATAHQWYGAHLYSLGRVDEAVDQLVIARDLDPVSPALGTDVTYGLYTAGKYQEALAEARRTVALDTTLSLSHWLTGIALLALNRPDSALVAFTTAQRFGDTPDARPPLVRTFRDLGRAHDAETTYASLKRSSRAGEVSGRDLAIAAASMGDLTTAMAAVKSSIARREAIITEYSLPCDRLLDPLKLIPEFGQLLRAAGMRMCPPATPR